MNMIVGVIIDVIVRENDDDTPENIALLEKISKDLDEIKSLQNNYSSSESSSSEK